MKLKIILFILLFCSAGLRAHAAPAAPETSTAAVTLDGKAVLILNGRELSLTAQERAQRVSNRLLRLSRDPLSDTDKIAVSEGDASSDIISGEMVLMSVTDKDARHTGMSRQALAAKQAELLRQAAASYRRDYNLKSILLGALMALLSAIAFFFLLKLIASFYEKVEPRITAWGQANIKSVKFQQMELLNAGRITGALENLLDASRILLTLLLLYFYLPILFSFFPWTRGFTPVLFGYILHPVASIFRSFIAYIPDMIFVAVTITVVHYLLKMLHAVAREVQREHIRLRGFYPDWARPTFQIIRFIAWAFTLVVIFPYLPGSSSPAFKGVSVFLGVLFSLGSSSAISNAVAGIMLTYMRPFKTGDRVKIGETVGDVAEKTLLVTRVTTIKNVIVTMPNALVLASHMINYSALSENEGMILNTSVTIGYDAPWPKVHELLIAAADDTGNLLKEPRPFVLQTALNDYNVSYELNAYTDDPRVMAVTYSNLHAAIQDKFNAAGIEIMSPAFAALRDGNAPAIPGAVKAPGAPSFRVAVTKTGE